ncbi:MAG: tetratricopeptide repeat protein [Alphaproteobacteria bacterium]|nr:tetratricopeptide repeat protein [Alphaproteobacteria bacterium]
MADSAEAAFAAGIEAFRAGRWSEAEMAFRRATKQGRHWRYDYLLGVARHHLGRNEEAAEDLARALNKAPDDPAIEAELRNNQAVVLAALGRRQPAIATLRKAVARAPTRLEAWSLLASLLFDDGEIDEALEAAERARALGPSIQAIVVAANVRHARRDFAGAVGEFQAALALDPHLVEALVGLGASLHAVGRLEPAREALERAVQARPDFAPALVNLTAVLTDSGAVESAGAMGERAVAAAPNMAEAHVNLANAYQNVGRIAEAGACFRRALALAPDRPEVLSSYIFLLDNAPEVEAETPLAVRRRWNRLFAAPVARKDAPIRDPDPGRRLKVGFVSADFKGHSASVVTAQPIRHLDRGECAIFLYSSVGTPDATTEAFRAMAEVYRDVTDLDDAALARRIEDDAIDILVDLSGHSAGNRLRVFARRPAPIQITAWGYSSGTGLDTMDWIVSDDYVAPPEHAAAFSEKILRLESWLCFDRVLDPPDIAPPPSAGGGKVVFGSFNRVTKLTEASLDLFAAALRAAPDSRLLIKDRVFDFGRIRARTRDALMARGIAGDRLDFQGKTTQAEHLAAYNRVDIALDTYPHTGGVTSVEALWMGVPILTLVGPNPQSRGTGSLLRQVGLADYIATDTADFAARAAARATEVERRIELRTRLRQAAFTAPAGDGPRYGKALTAALRRVWRGWCAEAKRPNLTPPENR